MTLGFRVDCGVQLPCFLAGGGGHAERQTREEV